MAAYVVGFATHPGYCNACHVTWCDGHDCGTGSFCTSRSPTAYASNVGYYSPPPEPEPEPKAPPNYPRLDTRRKVATVERVARPLTLARGVLPRARGDC